MGHSRRMKRICTVASGVEDVWRTLYGTEDYPNLPRHKDNENKEGNCWQPCPYSTQATAIRTRALLGLLETDPLPSKIDHTDANGVVHYMQAAHRGAWGYECTLGAACPGYSDGKSYFYT